jgi:hypothetical protein
LTQKKAAADMGLSPDQAKQSLCGASVLEAEFAAPVENAAPPIPA